MERTRTKQQRLERTKHLLLLDHPNGLGVRDLAHELGISYNSAWRYLKELNAVPVGRGKFRLCPSREDIELARTVLGIGGGVLRSTPHDNAPREPNAAPEISRAGYAYLKHQRLERAKRLLLLDHPGGLSVRDLARELGIAYNSAWRYVKELDAVPVGRGKFRLSPSREDIELARAVLKTAGNVRRSAPHQDTPHGTGTVPQIPRAGYAYLKHQRLERIKRLLLLDHPNGLRVRDLARELGIAYNTAWRYLKELNAVPVGRGKFRLLPSREDIELARTVLGTAGGARRSASDQAAPPDRSLTKQQRLEQAKRLLLCTQGNGMTIRELAFELGISCNSARRYLKELRAISVGEARFKLLPSQEDVELARAVLAASREGDHP